MCRILLVSNDLFISHVVSESLAEDGHRIEAAIGGMEALHKVSSFEPDLILIHRPLPDITVGELQHSFKIDQKTQEIPLILLSTVKLPEWDNLFSSIIRIPLDANKLRQEIQKIMSCPISGPVDSSVQETPLPEKA